MVLLAEKVHLREEVAEGQIAARQPLVTHLHQRFVHQLVGHGPVGHAQYLPHPTEKLGRYFVRIVHIGTKIAVFHGAAKGKKPFYLFTLLPFYLSKGLFTFLLFYFFTLLPFYLSKGLFTFLFFYLFTFPRATFLPFFHSGT